MAHSFCSFFKMGATETRGAADRAAVIPNRAPPRRPPPGDRRRHGDPTAGEADATNIAHGKIYARKERERERETVGTRTRRSDPETIRRYVGEKETEEDVLVRAGMSSASFISYW